ncbi:UvrD-helicase domain-containing protein [Massilicoli timonensis]|uniref:UvrD-helicase domain-containing protein n=1 Tax=Massilicoli timonensis TaxID=2015901 RepID=UPI0015E15040|nr:UvrD-helicase domain-containing protein [Massilicoli timonensis]
MKISERTDNLMSEIHINDEEIEEVEKLLLPDFCHFPDDAKKVICCWKSSDVAACPGSGKTTVLLAKLKLLAERMPLPDGAGVCVLSHTNVAVNEIKIKLNEYADRLINYPNYVGTIQSFVDKFVTMPYLRNISGRNIQVVDNRTYANHMLIKMKSRSKYRALKFVVEKNFETGNQFTDQLEHIEALHIRDNGTLCIGNQKRALAGADKPSTEQFKNLISNLLKEEGMIRYKDAYSYAKEAMDNLSEAYTELFSMRFKYVFIDEYQDCDLIQRQVLNKIFDKNKTCVFHIGDPDQAIYDSEKAQETEWLLNEECMEMASSNRYGQEVADVLVNLRTEKRKIISSKGYLSYVPTLIVFNEDTRDRVVDAFITALNQNELYDSKGIYKMIGLVKREELAGLKIGDYWDKFNPNINVKNPNRYWNYIDKIAKDLQQGKLYSVENEVRRLLCKLFGYTGSIDSATGNKYTVHSIKSILSEKYFDVYTDGFLRLSSLQSYTIENVNAVIREIANNIVGAECNETDAFLKVPLYFMDETKLIDSSKSGLNIYFDETHNRKIIFDTVHGVKGETHDATLYLETENKNSSDIKRILPYLGVGKLGSSKEVEQSRKCVYVGMSRPNKLLCLAIQESTYIKSKCVFSDWNLIDCRSG